MSTKFVSVDRNQPLLLLPNLREWIPKEHLVRFVISAVEDLDLTVCKVNTGSEEVQIVCGAPHHKTGDYVALAQVGTVLPGDFKIKKSKIRGQVSMGMLCSEEELGLSDEAEGIMILPRRIDRRTAVFRGNGPCRCPLRNRPDSEPG